MNIRENQNDDSFKKYRKAVESDFNYHREIKRSLIHAYIAAQKETDPNIRFLLTHETHHYWQTIFYPCLYFLSYLEFKSISKAAQNLRAEFPAKHADRIKLADLHFDKLVYHNIGYISIKFRLSKGINKFDMAYDISENQHSDPDVFSLNDLIEDATTLYSYKITYPASSAQDFMQWIRNPANRGYKRLIRFISKNINEEFAFRMLLPIVQLAFYTTEPITAFLNLLNFANMMALEHQLVSFESGFRLMKEFLQKEYKLPGSPIANDYFITESPTSLIDHETYKQISGHHFELSFPLRMHALAYLKEIEKDSSIESYLCNPTPETHARLNELFSPYAVFYNFLGLKTSSNAITLSPEFSKHPADPFGSPEELIIHLMRIREVTFSLLTGFNLDSPHNCHHTSCKYHQLQICRKWNSIPTNHAECEFPYWFRYVYHVDIDCESRELTKLTMDTATVEQEYRELINTKIQRKAYSYSMDIEDGKRLYILYVRQQTVESNDHDFIPGFIDWIKKSENISDVDVLDSLILDFSDYINDPRPLYEIPATEFFLTTLIAKHVWLLALLNFSSLSRNQAFFIIPLVVSVIKKKEFTYEVTGEERLHLVYLYYYAVNHYCEIHNIDKQIIDSLSPTFIKNN